MDEKKISARNYRELIVWQEGIKLAKAIYKLTEKFPRNETMHSLTKSVARLFLSRLLLLKVKLVKRQVIFADFCILRLALLQKWILNLYLHGSLAI